MRRILALFVVLGGIASVGLYAQSLGALARQERQRAAAEQTPPRVFTNDTLPKAGDITVGRTEAASPDETEKDKADHAAGDTKNAADLEKEWRGKFAKARENLSLDQRDLDVSQRQLNLDQVQFYSNPNQALQQQYSRTDINQLTSRVTELQAKVKKDQDAISQLQQQLHDAGLPAGWGR